MYLVVNEGTTILGQYGQTLARAFKSVKTPKSLAPMKPARFSIKKKEVAHVTMVKEPTPAPINEPQVEVELVPLLTATPITQPPLAKMRGQRRL